jgi:hypothetical protein
MYGKGECGARVDVVGWVDVMGRVDAVGRSDVVGRVDVVAGVMAVLLGVMSQDRLMLREGCRWKG